MFLDGVVSEVVYAAVVEDPDGFSASRIHEWGGWIDGGEQSTKAERCDHAYAREVIERVYAWEVIERVYAWEVVKHGWRLEHGIR